MNIDKLTPKQFAVLFSKIIAKVKEDPIENFVKAAGFIDFTPSAAQEVILKVIFQKRLDDTEERLIQIEKSDKDGNFQIVESFMTEVEIYEYLTEKKYDPENIADVDINKINLICGRRSGKTTLSAIISIYCAITNNWKPFLKKTPFATVLILSHSREFSDEVLEMIRTFIENSPVLYRLINKDKRNTTSTMNLSVPWIVDKKVEYSRVQIKVGAASSKTTRGVAACAVLCDEIAYWNLDESMKETDYKILKAVRPAMKQFGKHAVMIKLSSPGIKQGELYKEYKMSREGTLPESYAVFKAPSWMMNTILPAEEFVEEWKLDPDGFDVEYRSNFADSLSNFILPEYVDMAVVKGQKFAVPHASKNVIYKAAIDAAYKNDRFTFSVVGLVNDRVVQFVSHGWKGSRKDPVSAFEVAEYIKNVCKQYSIDEVAADQFSFQPLKEIFDRYGINLVEHPFTPSWKKKIYFNLKKLIHSQQIDLLDNELQTREIKELMVEQAATGTVKIGHPAAGSDDFADSLAVASYLCTEQGHGVGITFSTSSGDATYGIKVDINGRTMGQAPSADMLVSSGHLPENVIDNSSSYAIDPKDGRLKHISKIDDLIEEDEDDSSFIM